MTPCTPATPYTTSVSAYSQYRALAELLAERDRQDAKWGSQRALPPLMWLAILTEEVGEAAKEVCDMRALRSEATNHLRASDDRVPELRKELVQVAAVAVAWLEALP